MTGPAKSTVDGVDIAVQLRSRLVSGGIWSLAGKIALLASGIILNALLTRLLPPGETGKYFLVVTVVAIGAAVLGMGLPTVIVQRIASARASTKTAGLSRQHIRAVFRGTLLASATFAIASPFFLEATLTHFFASYLGTITNWVLVLVLIAILANLTTECLRGFHQLQWVSLLNGLLRSLLMISCLAPMLALNRTVSLTEILAFLVGCHSVVLIVALYRLRRTLSSQPEVPCAEEGSVVPLVADAPPYALAGIAIVVLTQADIWIVGHVVGDSDVALLAIAARLAVLVSFPHAILYAVLPPIVAELHSQGQHRRLQKTLCNTASLAVVPSLLVVGLFATAGGPLLSLLFGDFYEGASELLLIFAGAQLLNVWVGSAGVVMKMTGMGRAYLAITVIWGGVAVFAAYLAALSHGTLGVVIAFACARSLLCLTALCLVRLRLGIWTNARPFHLGVRLIRSRLAR